MKQTYLIPGTAGYEYEVEADSPAEAYAAFKKMTASGKVPKGKPKQEKPVDYDPTSDNPLENAWIGLGKKASDISLATRQTVAGLGGPGDEAALKKEAEDKAKIDRDLMRRSPMARAGSIGGDVALGMLPQFGVARAVGTAARGAGRAAQAGAYGASVPVAGAVENLLEVPDASGSGVVGRGARGAGQAVAGDLVARGIGRIARPVRSTSAGAVTDARTLEEAGFPGLLAENRTDSPMVRWLTQSLSRGASGGINEARRANLARNTEIQTAQTGTPVRDMAPGSVDAMRNPLVAEAQGFRGGPPVVVNDVPANLNVARENIENYGRATSQRQGASKLANAADATPQPVPLGEIPGRPPSTLVDEAGNPLRPAVPPTPIEGPPEPARLSADEVFNRRSHASELAHKEGDPILAGAYRDMRDIYGDALTSTHPDGGAAFDAWRRKWGSLEDITKAAGRPGGVMRSGELNPKAYAAALDEERRLTPRTFEDRVAMASERALPTGDSTGIMQATGMGLQYGLPIAGAVGTASTGEAQPLVGGAAAAMLAHAALGTRGGGRWLTGQQESRFMRNATDPENIRALINALNIGGLQ